MNLIVNMLVKIFVGDFLRSHICATTLVHPIFEHSIFTPRHLRSDNCAPIFALYSWTTTFAPRYLRPDIHICTPQLLARICRGANVKVQMTDAYM
jgi:hypothetical protein